MHISTQNAHATSNLAPVIFSLQSAMCDHSVAKLAGAMANTDPNRMVDFDGNGERTPLMQAAREGWADGVAMLLNCSDATLVDSEGMTALMHAADTDNAMGRASAIECARRLLPLSNANQVDGCGRTAVTVAAMKGNAHVLISLIPATDLSIRDQLWGNTALGAAIEMENAECAQALALHADARSEGDLIVLARKARENACENAAAILEGKMRQVVAPRM